MALVEVPDRGLDAQRAQRPHAADAQDQLLVQPHLAAADVQDVGDRPVGGVVHRVVRVEQQHRHAPDLDRQTATVTSRPGSSTVTVSGSPSRPRRARERQSGQVVVGVAVLLVAVGIDRLAEVAVAIQEPDADERQRHVAGGLHVVAGEDAEAARVDARATRGGRTRRRSRRSGPSSSSACWRWNQWSAPLAMYRSKSPMTPWYSAMKSGLSSSAAQSTVPAEDRDGVAVAAHAALSIRLEQVCASRMPAPAEVVGETPQALELRRERDELGGRQTG